jgi:flagellar assembly protein FliH
MSLSKHYKNPPAFKAEELVKKADRPGGGWTPSPTTPASPFTSQRLSRNLPAGTPTTRQADSLANGPPPPPVSPDQSFPAGETTRSAPPLVEIDPNRFIERAEAEQLAENVYQQGISEGLSRAEMEFGTTAKSLLLACQQLDNLRQTLIANSRQEMIEFALTVAERILRLSIREQDHTVIATIEEALSLAVKSDEFAVHINPDDFEILNAKAVDIIAGISGLQNIVIKKDNSIDKGGVFIESENCTIDATIASQLELIREEIRKRQ